MSEVTWQVLENPCIGRQQDLFCRMTMLRSGSHQDEHRRCVLSSAQDLSSPLAPRRGPTLDLASSIFARRASEPFEANSSKSNVKPKRPVHFAGPGLLASFGGGGFVAAVMVVIQSPTLLLRAVNSVSVSNSSESHYYTGTVSGFEFRVFGFQVSDFGFRV